MCGLPDSLSAKFEKSFAYKTVKDRLPVILTKVIDTTHRQRNNIIATYHTKGEEDIKNVLSQLSELRYRMTTDKPLLPIDTEMMDKPIWDDFYESQKKIQGKEPSWYSSPWLYVECYLYRRIATAFESSSCLKNWDPFMYQKEQAFVSSLPAIKLLGVYISGISKLQASKQNPGDVGDPLHILENVIQVCLWGNRCDLSISAGANSAPAVNQLDQVSNFKPYILVNHLYQVINRLSQEKNQAEFEDRIDIILDNAGLELYCDLCMAEVLLQMKLVSKVHFHMKVVPWFVSDVVPPDFAWTLEMLRSSDDPILNGLGHSWHRRITDGTFVTSAEDFWTFPQDFDCMKAMDPELHAYLSKSKLVFFKGDLNYRKLVGDLNWPTTTPLSVAMRNFKLGAPLVSLRTLKADVCVGLPAGTAEALDKKHNGPEWMVSGDYAVIHFCEPSTSH